MEYTISRRTRVLTTGPKLHSFIGKSTYVKPIKADIANMATGSDLYNIDTQEVFMYDRDTDEWIPQ